MHNNPPKLGQPGCLKQHFTMTHWGEKPGIAFCGGRILLCLCWFPVAQLTPQKYDQKNLESQGLEDWFKQSAALGASWGLWFLGKKSPILNEVHPRKMMTWKILLFKEWFSRSMLVFGVFYLLLSMAMQQKWHDIRSEESLLPLKTCNPVAMIKLVT